MEKTATLNLRVNPNVKKRAKKFYPDWVFRCQLQSICI